MDVLALKVAARYKKKTISEKGNPIYMYSERQIALRNKKKAERLEKLRKNISRVQDQVKKDLGSGDPNKVLTALVVGLMDETFERVGNEESADEGHFGVTGWQKSHVSFGKGKATISYVGKAGVKQKKTVTNKALVSALKDAYEACEGDCIFEHAGGKVTAEKVNAYLKQFDITAKDIRGYHANRVMKEALKAGRKGALPEDKKEREKVLKAEFKKALEETAKAVGHEAATLKNQYLVPGLEDDFMADGRVDNKMTKEAAASADVLVQRVLAAVQRMDLAWVESLRKDFLTLMKNLPKVKDYETAIRLREAFVTYRKHFDALFFKTFLDKDLKYNLGLSEGDAKYIDKRMRVVAWSFSTDLANIPIWHAGKYDTEGGSFAKFERDLPKWEARMRRSAQTFWKEMREVINWFESYHRPIDVKPPTVEKSVLEGFQVVVRGYEHEDEYNRDGLEALKEGLRIYRKKAGAVAPILLKKQVPIQMEFKTTLDKGGEYDQGTQTITFYVSSIISKGPFWVAHALAHEMGHHLWHTVLSNEAQEFWVQTIKGDYGDLDVAELLAKWPEGAWAFDMTRYLGDKDPILALQAEAVSQDYEYNTKEEFQAVLDRGIRTLRTPKTPITGYANKNPEEGFCEAIGILVAYGAQAVHERVRAWLHTAMPGEIKVAARRRKPLVVPEPPSLAKLVQNAAESEVERAANVDFLAHVKKVHVLGQSSFSDGKHPSRYSSDDTGYAFTVRYPTNAVTEGAVEMVLDEGRIVRDVVDELELNDVSISQDDIRAELAKTDYESLFRKILPLAFGDLPDEHDLPEKLVERIEAAAEESVDTSIEAYTNDDPDLKLSEYPDVYLKWRIQKKRAELTTLQVAGSKIKLGFRVLWEIQPSAWAFEWDARRNDWNRATASVLASRIVKRFASKIDWAPSEPAMHEFKVPVGSTYEATVFLDVPGEYDRQRKARAGGYAEIDEYLFTEIETNGEHLLEQNLKSNIERRIGKSIAWTERAWGARRHTKHFRVV